MAAMSLWNTPTLKRGYEKDFGYGFYCTNLEMQARKWALTKKGAHYVNVYELSSHEKCRKKVFQDMTEE